MNSSFRELSLDEIAEVTKLSPRAAASSKVDTSIRTVIVWFKLPQYLGFCSNPECGDPRPKKVEEGNAMVAEVNNHSMCRYCFLVGYGN